LPRVECLSALPILHLIDHTDLCARVESQPAVVAQNLDSSKRGLPLISSTIPVANAGLPGDSTDGAEKIPVPSRPKSTITFPGTPKFSELRPPSPTKFQWLPALGQSALYTGIMHAFRFPSEAGTRDALNGPFLENYKDSILALRGWSDGDTFVTSYVAHPMEGAIFGFIQQQNDPLYRNVQFGDGQRYWMSRLRAAGFSSVMSTQWKLGLVSEASLGNVQLHDSPGFVDLAGTSSIGFFWMIGEDILDKYGIARLEKVTANRVILVLARSFGNPTRSFANLMAFGKPWERANRPGIFRDAFDTRSEFVRARRARTWEGPEQWHDFNHIDTGIDWRPNTGPLPQIPDFEIMTIAQYETFLGGGSCIGGGANGSVHLGPQFSIVSEVSGCLIINMPRNQSGDSLTYLVGSRWTPRASRRASPFFQFLMGGRRITHEVLLPDVKEKLLKEWNGGSGTHPQYPMRRDYTFENQANGFAVALGGGLDLRLNAALAFRVANVEYTHSWLPDVDVIHPQKGLRFSSGLILRVGTW
jgi:hypothetical protein